MVAVVPTLTDLISRRHPPHQRVKPLRRLGNQGRGVGHFGHRRQASGAGPRESEPDESAADRRPEPGADGRSQVGWIVAETAATSDAEIRGLRSFRINMHWFLVVICGVPVPAPFPHIAVHVI